MKFFALLLASAPALACPQFNLTNITCTGTGGQYTVERASLQGNTLSFTTEGQTYSRTFPSSETDETGLYSEARCEGNQIVGLQRLGSTEARSVITYANGELRASGQGLGIQCESDGQNQRCFVREVFDISEVCR